MRLHIWGIDFKRNGGEERRHFFIPPELRAATLQELRQCGFEDLVYLATCNRIEFFTTAKDPFSDTRNLWMALLKKLGISEEKYFLGYHLEGKAAVRHLLRVACSLESLVVGEPQILGQLKDALAFSLANQLPVHPSLHRVFQLAFETAKRVRTETSIADKPVSIATLGIKHLQSREKEHPLTHVAVVGRSPICRAVLQWILDKRPGVKIAWVNRSVEKLGAFEESKRVELIPLGQFLSKPLDFSHLITATSSLEPLFDQTFFGKLPARKKLVFDFAEPVDVVDSHVPAHVRLVKLEDLRDEALRNAQERKQGIDQAEAIIDSSLRDFCRSQKEAPLLKDFNQVKPSFDESFRLAWEEISMELPLDCHPKVRKWAEGLVKKNLHLSREHLKEVLRKVTDPYDSQWP